MAVTITSKLTGGAKWKCSRCGAKGSDRDKDKAQQQANTHRCPR
jgi:predicted RNA-binding Zn-ribbon protein involved in translation (DUF1610 family)